MDEIRIVFREAIDGDLIKIVFSKMRKKSGDLKRVEIRPVAVKDETVYQISYFHDMKVTHENMDKEAAVSKCTNLVENAFKQVNIFTTDEDVQILANKPSKPRILRSCASLQAEDVSHDRKKNYIIPEGTPCDFLVHLGVMDKNGKVYKKYYSKFRQINRFLEIVDDVYPALAENGDLSVSYTNNAKEPAAAIKPLKIIDLAAVRPI